jgi:hypothetical protein
MGRLAQRSAVARSPALWARSGGFMHHCAHTSNSIALLVPRAFLSVGVGSRDGGPIGATVRFLRPKATRFQMFGSRACKRSLAPNIAQVVVSLVVSHT